MVRKLKNNIAKFIYWFILFYVKLIKIESNKKNRHLLIIKTDEIGDYILFRKLLPYFKMSTEYRDYEITLLGNIAFKQIFDKYDTQYIDNSIWIDKKKFKSNLRYRFNELLAIKKSSFTEVVNCIYSRGINFDDAFVSVIDCNKKIGMMSDFSNRSPKEIRIEKKIYNELIDSGNTNLFDVYRNINFLHKVLKIDEIKKCISIDMNISTPKKVNNYCVVFTGAGKADKKWKPEFFAEIVKYIIVKHKVDVVFCGSPVDVNDTNAVLSYIEDREHINDFTGRTSLTETLEILNNAKFVLSVDTGSVHLAVAVNCPVIGLFSGKHYGRFAPYPKEIFNNFFVIYPDNIDKLIQENSRILSQPNLLPNEAIQKILPIKVKKGIDFMVKAIFEIV